ncbi:MAG TPA: NPCBM/NEW2 domain-containing protein [Thermoguttaceae bacterium]|nr:NPCBM/NEW2 domain-containing protein [Thermoguttaceae bacterium]
MPHTFDAHATSSLKFKLSGKCTEFHASYGLKTNAGGAAVFVILADEKEVFRTGEIYGYGHTYDRGTKTPVTLDVTGVKVLELKALAVRGGAGAWSCWGDPKVR